MQIVLSPRAAQLYPGACFGFLALDGVANPASPEPLEARKAALQDELRGRYTTPEMIKDDAVVQAYSAYYKKFKKTYHVAMQLESVALKGRSIPAVAALVECMFMAELEDRLLTAGHDLATLQGDIRVSAASGGGASSGGSGEQYTLLRGTDQALKADDLFMQDETGVISSIVYGPDARTQISAVTTRALFAVYAPPGVGAERVNAHLERILEYVRVVSPQAQVLLKQVIS
jgi:DNA/RNA-binding domain of Phe-tRNA-synthetase-like protein